VFPLSIRWVQRHLIVEYWTPSAIRPRMTSVTRVVVLAVVAIFGQACSSSEEERSVVLHRCGELNMDSISGSFGRLDGEQAINSKFRILFSRDGGKVGAKFVAGGHERFAMVGHRTGNESMDFTEVGDEGTKRRRLKVSLNAQCRLQVEDGWIAGSSQALREIDHPSDPYTFVPFDLSRLDFEPCTERLAIGKAARGGSPGKVVALDSAPVITADSLTVAQWSPRSVLSEGCTAELGLWVNGEAEALDVPVELGGSTIHWRFEYETRFLGKKGLAMHRIAKCSNNKQLLGVACASIEVK